MHAQFDRLVEAVADKRTAVAEHLEAGAHTDDVTNPQGEPGQLVRQFRTAGARAGPGEVIRAAEHGSPHPGSLPDCAH